MSSAELREKAAVFLAAIGSDSVDDEGKGDALIASALYECTAALIDALPSERERAELAAMQGMLASTEPNQALDYKGLVEDTRRITDLRALLNAREAKP